MLEWLNSFFNAIFGGVVNQSKVGGLLFISLIMTLISTLAYKYLTDQEAIKRLKEEVKEIQKEMKEFRDNPKRMLELQKKSFEKGFFEMMRHQIKPLIFTLLPFILVFNWLRATYSPLGDLAFGFGWFGIYFVSAIIFSISLRKLLKVH